jgi:RNA polymerase sigma factor (sigma-70 family)
MRCGSGSVIRSIQTLFDSGSATGMSDRELLEQFLARGGDLASAERAFAAIVARHGPMVWSICRSIAPDSHTAEDAFQATFLILVRSAGAIRRHETLGPWLHGVARRVAVRAKATVSRRQRHEERGAEMKAISPPDRPRFDEIEAIHQEIGRLPERYRDAVILCHLEGFTHAQAARILKCPSGTVSIRVSRAKDLLRERLVRRGLAFATIAASSLALPETTAAANAIPLGLAESTVRAAMLVAATKALTAGTVSAAVSQLTAGALRIMTLQKITIATALVLTTASAASGIALFAMGQPAANPVLRQAAANPQQDQPGEKKQAAEQDTQKAREKCMRNLRIISLAFHNLASRNGPTRFPPAAIRSKDGKPLLSWRVAALPFLEQNALYNRFHLEEPWDSPHNKALLKEMPEIYAPVLPTDEPRISTYYQVFTCTGALFEDPRGPALTDIKDGTSNTLMVVEAGTPVPWTKPEDIEYDKKKPLPKLGRQFDDGFFGAMADSSVRFFGNNTNKEFLRALITMSGGEIISFDQERAFPRPDAPRGEPTPAPATPKPKD